MILGRIGIRRSLSGFVAGAKCLPHSLFFRLFLWSAVNADVSTLPNEDGATILTLPSFLDPQRGGQFLL
jgi:hypothetical protein